MTLLLKCILASPSAPDWLTALGTVGACVIALVIALFGKRMEHWFYHPELLLSADVRRPDSEKTGRWVQVNPNQLPVDAGEAWFFRLRVLNEGNAPAKEVQVFLNEVEKMQRGGASTVLRFTPMNLKWTHTHEITRHVVLPKVPVFCDFAHLSEPKYRAPMNEDLEGVPKDDCVICLDVQVQTSERSHLLEPGEYRCHLVLAAENTDPQEYIVELAYSGKWSTDQDTMFDEVRGFRMNARRKNE